MSRELAFVLPFPPAANNLFVNLPKGGRFTSPRYKAWQAEASAILMEQRPGVLHGPVEVNYTFGRPDNRRRDVFNLEKAVSDIIVKHGIIKDDSLIYRGTVEWSNTIRGVKVTIKPLDTLL